MMDSHLAGQKTLGDRKNFRQKNVEEHKKGPHFG